MTWKIVSELKAILAAEAGAQVFPPGSRQPVAFVYPNRYRVGMSNLGLHILYRIINGRGDSACERFFLPDPGLLNAYRSSGTPLLSLETQRPLADFAVVFVMLSFELDYDNLLTLLELGKLKLRAAERGERDPLVIIGGPCATFNPEPLAAVADAFVIGEGEVTVGRILDTVYAAADREACLLALAQLPGVYVPRFYTPEYAADGSFLGMQHAEAVPPVITRQWLRDLEAYPHTSAILTPHTEFADMYLVEVARGCGRHCRFCMAGYCFRRPRPRPVQAIAADIARRPARTAKIGLMGAAVSDHPQIAALTGMLAQEGVPFAMASLRADSLNGTIAAALAASGQHTLTVAPEAGSVQLRAAINKGITEEHVQQAVALALAAGMQHLKLYYMLGLPQEADADFTARVEMIGRIRSQLDASVTKGELIISVNPFVPKPFTPYQWEGLCALKLLKRRLKMLTGAVQKTPRVKIITESLKETLVQAILARGDRRIGAALLAAHTGGRTLKAELASRGVDAEAYACRQLPAGRPLPWQHLQMGFSEAYLLAERARSRAYQFTPPCFEGCGRCGVCGEA